MHCLQHTPPPAPLPSLSFSASSHSLCRCRCPLNCWHFSSAVWTNSCAIKRIDYTTNKSRSETKAAEWSKAARQQDSKESVDPCPLCSEIRAALIWARQTLNEAKFVLLATEKHKVKEMCVAYFQARALIKKYPRLAAAINCQRERLLRCHTQSCCQ